MSRELNDFVGAFFKGATLMAHKKRTDAIDGARADKQANSTGAWTQAHEDAYKQQYGTASGFPISGGGSSSSGLMNWIKRRPGLIMNAAPAGTGAASQPAYGAGSVQTSALPDISNGSGSDDGFAGGFDGTEDVSEAARGGVIRAVPHYAGGGAAVGSPVEPPVIDSDITGHAVPPEPDLPPVLYDNNGQPTGWHEPAKALNDQTRVAAFNPDTEGAPAATGGPVSLAPRVAVPIGNREREPNRNAGGDGLNSQGSSAGSSNNVNDDLLGRALDGGLKFAMHTFHLKGDGVAVGKDPHQEGGQRALMTGVGAADPESVQATNGIVHAMSQDKQTLEGPLGQSILGMRRLEIVYQHFVQTGQTDKANKAAFELIQYGAGEAAKHGTMATQQLRTGDVNGAINSVVKGLDEIPDGRKVTVGPDGKTAVWTDTRSGKVVGEYKFAPKDLFNMALGLSNRSTYWDVVMQRAAMTNPGMVKDAKAGDEAELRRARIELTRARTDKLRQPKAGTGAVVSPLAAQLEAIDNKRITRPAATATTEPAAPIPQGGGEEPAPRDPAMEDAESGGLEAPADLKDNVNQSLPPGKGAPVSVTAPPGKYDTKLSPDDEAKFQAWVAGKKNAAGGNISDDTDYDTRGWWKSGAATSDNGHGSGQWKKPSHPTFSDESQYHDKDGNVGGRWVKAGTDSKGNDKWDFEPGQTNVNNGLDKTRDYLKISDPEVTLREPSEEKLDGVPDVVIHNGKPVQMKPGKAPDFNEAHPLTPFNGKNPYTAILADPKNSPWFATKQGKSDKTGLTRKAAEIDRDVQDWDKRRKEYTTEFTKAHVGDVAAQRAEAKKIYDKPIAPEAVERLAGVIDPIIAELAKSETSNVIKDGGLKAPEATKMALDLIERNRAMPVGHAVNMLNELTRSGTPGEDDKKWRSFTPKGKDLVGNVIVQLNGDKSVELHLAPSTYKKINSVVDGRFKKKEEAAKKPAEQTFTDKVIDAAKDLPSLRGAADYVLSPEGLPGVKMDNPQGRSGMAAHGIGMATLPFRAIDNATRYLKANPNGPMVGKSADVTGQVDPSVAIGGRTSVELPKRAVPRWGNGG